MSMITRHTTDQERMLYVMDALEADKREQLEAHLLSCPNCHAAVLAEARVELNLRELCAQLPPDTMLPPDTIEVAAAPRPLITASHPAVRATRWQPMHLALWAMSAAVVLMVLWRSEPTSTRQPRPSQARQLFTASSSLEPELTSRAPEDQDEALACNQLAGQRLCTADSAGALVASAPPSLSAAVCESEGSAADETACLLPAAPGTPEFARTCGP